MQTIRCLIIDDEPIARALLADYCSYMNNLEVIALCADTFQAREIISNQLVDVIFLDINMPVLDGISFLKTLKNPPQVIFTTAYRKYATTAFDLAACDYLVKPFSLERFIQAVDRAMQYLTQVPQEMNHEDKEYILVKSENKIYNLKTADVLFAEAKGNYTHIVFSDQVLKPKLALTALEAQLPPARFLRVHRSFIINKTMINHIAGNRIMIDRHEIPLGNSFKESFAKALHLND
ncbi:LytTR family DNA-binding domain-containing protein [Pedobacter sp. MC2016-24]|uniref:LytR/AlgR family response regulator transcription factor n=1 Tax=Pedobacter sp. MC2016-24 TaxID=2780090 RepID=UPI001880C367|nr:LytTR family DNA-binding domain-containing protein [Pedobacter sp. MC2016-24]MBE9602356.1 response regulator transcription factor [Pedobacter sp. MC2016-24]